jgi:hypothetical protein
MRLAIGTELEVSRRSSPGSAMISTKHTRHRAKESPSARGRREHREGLESWLEPLMRELASAARTRRLVRSGRAGRLARYRTEQDELVQGVLLDVGECRLLAEWWNEVRLRRRGRPEQLPSLFDDSYRNSYRNEFESERQRIIAAAGKEWGATKQATAILAARHDVSFDAMRKRLKRK